MSKQKSDLPTFEPSLTYFKSKSAGKGAWAKTQAYLTQKQICPIKEQQFNPWSYSVISSLFW